MSIGELLDELAEQLAGQGVPPARAIARDLIAGVLEQAPYWPSAHRDDHLDARTVASIRRAADRMREGMPIQYAVGHAAFRHLTLLVDRRVLIPRPETELLVDLVLAAQRGGTGTVVDVGTGSGAIALSLATEGSFDQVIGTDLSADAIAVATLNLERIAEDRRSRVSFRVGDLLSPIGSAQVDTIVSNPPYISPAESVELPSAVRDWEPHVALFAEGAGMAVILALVPQAAAALAPGGLLAMEVDSRRATFAADAVSQDGRFTDVETRRDLTGRPRYVMARRKEQ